MFISKMFANKRRYRRYKARTKRLPTNYGAAVDGVERYLIYFGPSEDWNSMQPMLDDLADLFEQSAADSTPIRAVVGQDPVEFAEEFLRNYPGGSWINKERERLANAIKRASGDDTANGGISR